MKFYPSADNFTQALLVMLVTNFMSDDDDDGDDDDLIQCGWGSGQSARKHGNLCQVNIPGRASRPSWQPLRR